MAHTGSEGTPTSFATVEKGPIIEDTVHYRLPFGPFGDLFHPLVRLQLRRIFRFRQWAVRRCVLGRADRWEHRIREFS